MVKSLLSLFMIGAAIAAFVLFINPRYQEINDLRAEELELDQALGNSALLRQKSDELVEKYNNLQTADLGRLEAMVPDNIDNVKLILELDVLASTHGLQLRNAQVEEAPAEARTPEEVDEQRLPFGTVGLEITVTGDYASFAGFLEDLERSLRIIDVEAITFSAVANSNDFAYTLSLKTYWLK